MSNTPVEASGTASPSADTSVDGFLEKAKKILTDLLEVKVVTGVGDVDIQITTDGDSTTTTLRTVKPLKNSIVTVVKVADGDVTTIISDDLLANAELRAFHTEQVEKSLTVLPGNLRALVDVAHALLGRGAGE